MIMEKKLYRIEEVAKITGLTKRAIRYYEDIELIKPVRTESQYRLYSDEDIDRISRIRSYKDSLGFSLNEVKDVFDLELIIRGIIEGEHQDKEMIEKSVHAINKQIELIEQKEETMKRVKAKYMDILADLDMKANK